MASFSNCSFSRGTSLSYPTLKPHQPINSLPCTNFFKPFSSSSCYRSFSLPRQKISLKKLILPKRSYLLVEVTGLVDDNPETYPEAEPSDSNTVHRITDEIWNPDLDHGAAIDTKLPRRRLLVQFTCNECGERTQRLINRLAYERGLVYVQCAGCERYHKLADNLGLIIEYDFLEEMTENQKPIKFDK